MSHAHKPVSELQELWKLPMRRVVFTHKSRKGKTFPVSLHAATDQDARKEATEILRACQIDPEKFCAGSVTLIPSSSGYVCKPIRPAKAAA